MNEELLELLAHELGEILNWEEEYPGVYYLSVLPADGIAREYYAVLEDAPISREARAMGRTIPDGPALLYPLEAEDGAWTAAEYELLRERTRRSLPLPEGKSLWEAALYGAELRPDYFGAYPVPQRTPWGRTLRHRLLDNGIVWIETERCAQALAVCLPIGTAELSDTVQSFARKMQREDGVGYLYFSKEMSCTAIFELLAVRPAWLEAGLIRKAELMNAIWAHCPEYALAHNAREQSGLHDGLGLLIRALGGDAELHPSSERMIRLTPEAGTDLIGFWR